MPEEETARRPPIRSFEDLEVYQRSIEVLVRVHRLLRSFPDYERHELSSQVQRASKSVPSNVAEGYGRKRSAKDFKSFLDIAIGSSNEMVVHLEVAKRLEYALATDCEAIQDEYRIIAKQLYRLQEAWC